MLKIMLPMVTLPRELSLRRARCSTTRIAAALGRSRRPGETRRVSASWSKFRRRRSPDLFDADFFSIGSNDLTQCIAPPPDARYRARIPICADPCSPRMLRLLRFVVEVT